MATKKSPARAPQSTGAQQKLGILTNPFSRANVVRLPRYDGEQVTQSLAEVPRAVDRLLDDGATAIAINGGDGTLGAAISHMEKRGKLLPIVPVLGGTNNSVAKDAHSVGRIDEVVRRFRTTDVPWIERNTLRVGDHGLGFIFSTGLIVRLTEAYYKGPWYGPAQAARVVATCFFQPNLWNFERNQIAVDDTPLSLPNGAQLSFLSTIDTQILFFKPFQVAAGALTGFNALVNAMPSTRVARHLWPIARGRFHGDGHWTQQAHRFTIAGTPKIFIDGELREVDHEVTVTPGPRVRFLQV